MLETVLKLTTDYMLYSTVPSKLMSQFTPVHGSSETKRETICLEAILSYLNAQVPNPVYRESPDLHILTFIFPSSITHTLKGC